VHNQLHLNNRNARGPRKMGLTKGSQGNPFEGPSLWNSLGIISISDMARNLWQS